jgi:propanediol dehydratase large subunit
MFLESNICSVSSRTVRAGNCWLPQEVREAKLGMKKWHCGCATIQIYGGYPLADPGTSSKWSHQTL